MTYLALIGYLADSWYYFVHIYNLVRPVISVDRVVSVFLRKEDGESLAKLVDQGLKVRINISVGHVFHHVYNSSTFESPSASRKSSIMLVTSLSFIVLLIFGLIGLLVYAVRRSKYIQNKNRTPMVCNFMKHFDTFKQSCKYILTIKYPVVLDIPYTCYYPLALRK